jgi:hypothetical protein
VHRFRTIPQYAACTLEFLFTTSKTARCRTVPHGGFAAVQDDITSGGVIPIREMHCPYGD